MPLNKLPLPIMYSQSSDETSLPDQIGARLVNAYVEKIGDIPIVRKAPGLETNCDITHTGTSPALAIGTTTTAVASGAFLYSIAGIPYYKAAVTAGTAPGNDVIAQSKYGAVAFDIDSTGTIAAVEATGQAAAEFTTAALAVAALPACDSSKHRMGWVTATKSDGAFTFGTTALNAANSTVTYTNATVSPTITIPYSVDGQFWWDALGLVVIVVNGRFYKKTTDTGAATDITGDALTVTGVPVTFATNGWCLMAASGGKIVTWHLYGSPITAPGLTFDDSPQDKLKFVAFTCYIEGVSYSITATDNISPGTVTVPQNKYGALAVDVDYAGSVTVVPAAANATGYDTAALAIAALNVVGSTTCATNRCRVGWVTVMCTDAGGFIFETTAFDAANTTVTFTDNTLYSAETTKFLEDTDAPTAVTHVAWMDGYFLCNEVDTAQFHASDTDVVANWSSLSYGTAEGHPDHIVALHIANREITLFGKDSIEVYYNDGYSVFPFTRLEGGYQERGCLAPYSVVNAAGIWIFLDNERRVVALKGRDIQVLSGPYDNIIRDIDKVSDAYASYFTLGVHSFYSISFPSVERTFTLNLTTQTWAENGDWDAPTFKLWKGRGYCYARDWEMHLIGDDTEGKIYKIRGDYFKQGTDNIRTLMRTGQISHGTYEQKISEELILRVKRGTGATTVLAADVGTDVEEPVFTIRWRNEDMVWKPEKTVSLGKAGDDDYIVRLFRNGVYRTRQYEIVHSSPSDFILSDMEERVLLISQPSPGGAG